MATNKKGDVELVVSAKNEATKTINELVESLERLGKEAGTSGIGGLFKKLSQSSSALARDQDELTAALKRSKQAQDQLGKANTAREKDLQSQREAIDKTEKSLAQLNAEYAETASAASRTRKPSEALVKTYEKQQARQDELAVSIKETTQRVREAQAEFDKNKGVDDNATRKIEQQRKKVVDLGVAWRETTQAVAQAQRVLSQRAQVRDSGDDGQKQAQARLDASRKELAIARQLESEKRKIVRESKEATDEEVQAKDQAIAATKRLKAAVAEQVVAERQARAERDAGIKSYRTQAQEVDKLTTSADKQKTAYLELKGSLAGFENEQKNSSTERQRQNIEKLNVSLEKLQGQYEAAAARAAATQGRLAKASGPAPEAVRRFDLLKQKINETEAEIKEQTAALEKLQQEYNQAGASAEQLAQKERQLEDITEQLTEDQRRLSEQTDKTAKATDRAGKEATQASRRFKAWGDDSRQTLGFLQRIRGELLAIAAAYTGVFAIGGAIRGIFDASVITEKATARLTARLGNDLKQQGEEFKFVRELADRLGISYGDLLDQYTRFLSAVPDGTLALEEIKFSFTAVAEASRVAGLSLADIQGVFVALSQLAGKGINLEDLRQQLQERIPGATEALRVGISELEGEFVSLEEVLERINKAELSGAAIVPLALGLSRQFGEGLPQAVDSAQAALGRFQTEIFNTKVAIAEAGFIDVLVNGLKTVTQELKKPEVRQGIQQLANGLVAAVEFGILLVKNLDTILALLKAVIALKLAGYFASIATQLVAMNAAFATSVSTIRAATGALATMRAVLISLLRTLLLLPAAFYAGFAIGDQLQKEFASVRKFGLVFVSLFEELRINVSEKVDLMTTYFSVGWLEVIKDVAKFLTDLIPAALELVLNKFAGLYDNFSKSMADSIRGVAASIGQSNDVVIDTVFGDSGDRPDLDEAQKQIRANAEEARKQLRETITQMFVDIDEAGKKPVLDPDKAADDANKYGEDYIKTLGDLDFTRVGSNAGRSLGESLLTQFRNIQRTLEEESADTLEERLALIRTEFTEFLTSISEFQANGDQQILGLRETAEAQIAAVRSRSGLAELKRQEQIAAIRQRTESQVEKIRGEQAALGGAADQVRQLIALRQEKERQATADKAIEEAQKRINDLTRQRKVEQDKVTELAELNLITTEEQGRRLDEINDRSIAKIQQAIGEAKVLAEETGNVSLANFADSFGNFEEVERRRAAVDEISRIEQQITDELSLRQTRLATLNTLRETGAIDAATAEEQSKVILTQSNDILGEMIDKALVLAQALGDEALVAKLQNIKAGLVEVNDQVFNGADLSQSFASGFAGAFDSFIQGTKSAGDAFRSFVADFLRQIATAIVQALVLRAITGALTGGSGGAGGAVAAGLNATLNHSGGVVGRDGTRRMVSPMAFLGAVKYHSGGVAGLKPNEVPTILEKGEEVLTTDNPRHRNNQGSEGQPGGVKIINAIDSSSVVTEGLNTSQGQKAIVNMIRANKAQIKSVLA